MERFIGGSLLAVFVRLVVISIVTGIALSALGFNTDNLLAGITQLIEAISNLGVDWVKTALRWLLLGAVIVIPVWLVLRFVKFIAGDTGNSDLNKRT